VAFLVFHLAYVAAGHRFKLIDTKPSTWQAMHDGLLRAPADARLAVFMTSSDFVVTLYSFGLDGNPTKLVRQLTFYYLP
jgi:hypothetical protein